MLRKRNFLCAYCKDLGGKVKCNFCNKPVNGFINPLKYHLTQIPLHEVKACQIVSTCIKHQAIVKHVTEAIKTKV